MAVEKLLQDEACELFFQPCHTAHMYTLAFTYTLSGQRERERVKLIQFAHLCVASVKRKLNY